jgi:hypothetical protein
VKAEPGSSNAPVSPDLCGNKMSLKQANGEEGPPPSVPLNTPPPGFPRKPRHFPSRHGGESTEWKAARELLQRAVAPPQEHAFAASEPSDVVRSSYAAVLQVCMPAANSMANRSSARCPIKCRLFVSRP